MEIKIINDGKWTILLDKIDGRHYQEVASITSDGLAFLNQRVMSRIQYDELVRHLKETGAKKLFKESILIREEDNCKEYESQGFDLIEKREDTKVRECSECGWKDGDGTKVCRYDEAMGLILHSNSIEAAKKKCPATIKSVWDAYDETVYIFPRRTDIYCGCGKKHKTGFINSHHQDVPKLLVEAALTNNNYVVKRSDTLISIQPRHLNTKHENCDGFVEFVEPYHLACRRCKQEVRMWEYGLDYDIG